MSEAIRNLTMPGVQRYQPKDLKEIYGHDNQFMPVAEVQLAVVDELADIGVIPAADYSLLTDDLRDEIMAITTTEIEGREREVTKHDVRAQIQLVKEILPPQLARWWHVPLTSYDPLDSGRVLLFIRAFRQVMKPKMAQFITILQDLVLRYSNTVQIGRTHGQHALPITVGFWLATILNRVLYNARAMEQFTNRLVGKLSGAVGAYNAQVGLNMVPKHGPSLEVRVLRRLGLRPGPISTQILQPETVAYFLFSCLMQSAALAQLGRDGRHLMRSEIAEIGEPFEAGQAGSSTMAQKRNPINFENLEGMYIRTKNEFGKVLDTMISEHQRDLVGSSVARDFPIIIINLTQQLDTLLRKDKAGVPFLARIKVNELALERNFSMSAKACLAEPVYIALQMAGYMGDAHKIVNERAVAISRAEDIHPIDAVEKLAESDEELAKAVAAVPEEIKALLHEPKNYVGKAQEKALQIAGKAAMALRRWAEE